MFTKCEDNGRHEVRETYFVVLRNFEERLQLEPRHRHDRCARVKPHVQHDHESVDVEQRQDANQRVRLEEITKTFHLTDVRDQVVMREHDTFRQASSAARVRQRDKIFMRIDLDLLGASVVRSEEHTSELQSQSNLVCRLLLEKKKKKNR